MYLTLVSQFGCGSLHYDQWTAPYAVLSKTNITELPHKTVEQLYTYLQHDGKSNPSLCDVSIVLRLATDLQS
jgi:hypothetical protein